MNTFSLDGWAGHWWNTVDERKYWKWVAMENIPVFTKKEIYRSQVLQDLWVNKQKTGGSLGVFRSTRIWVNICASRGPHITQRFGVKPPGSDGIHPHPRASGMKIQAIFWDYSASCFFFATQFVMFSIVFSIVRRIYGISIDIMHLP